MDKNFDKILLLLMSVSFIFLIATSTQNTADGKTNITENQYPGIMRFHVIANSDYEYDQDLKLKVRDNIISYLKPKLEKSQSISQSEEIIKSEYENLYKISRQTIKENGYDYDV